MSDLKLNSENMRTAAKKIDSEKQTVIDFINKMDRNIKELRDAWESEAAQEFESIWEEVKKSLNKIQENLIPDIKKQIDYAAENYDSAERVTLENLRRG